MDIAKIKRIIAGEIIYTSYPGLAMKKWREIFKITQKDLAKALGITPSTLSDYEKGRRKSPGAFFIKRFVDVLFSLDAQRGGVITKQLMDDEESMNEFFERYDFSQSITLEKFAELIEGNIVTNHNKMKEKIYGYTILDSIKIILDMPFEYFPRLYGGIIDRAFIFLGVSTGRSPMVVLRVAPTKPKAVVLHNIKKIDPLAIKISEREEVPILTTFLDVSEIKKRLMI